MANLRDKLVKLANEKPELRKHLIPILKTAANENIIELTYMGIHSDDTYSINGLIKLTLWRKNGPAYTADSAIENIKNTVHALSNIETRIDRELTSYGEAVINIDTSYLSFDFKTLLTPFGLNIIRLKDEPSEHILNEIRILLATLKRY